MAILSLRLSWTAMTTSCCTAALAISNPGSCWKSRSEEHTSELQSPCNLVCRLLLEKKNKIVHRLVKADVDHRIIVAQRARCAGVTGIERFIFALRHRRFAHIEWCHRQPKRWLRRRV